MENGLRNMWVTETALTTALNMSYMAEQLSLFGIVVGVALLLTGIGFLVLAIGGALRKAPGERLESCAAAHRCGDRLSGDSARARRAASAALPRSRIMGAWSRGSRRSSRRASRSAPSSPSTRCSSGFLEAAASLTDARYAALGVIDPGGTGLERFLVIGLDEQTRTLIGEDPHGRGLLGTLIREAKPLRLRDLTAHPDSSASRRTTRR